MCCFEPGLLQFDNYVLRCLPFLACCTGPAHQMHWYCAVLCSAVPCRAVLCCAVLCCAVMCCAVLCCAVLCYFTLPDYTILYGTVSLYNHISCSAMFVCVFHGICHCILAFCAVLVELAVAMLRTQAGHFELSKLGNRSPWHCTHCRHCI